MSEIDEWAGDVHHGDALEVLEELPAESVHAVVTDPPYGLAFMGRDWDDFEPKEYQEWCEVWAGRAKRVLKPGGHLLAFSGNRTHHRLFAGVEDAGFEIRDTVTWHYGSGFPKALDVSKAIDKRRGEEGEFTTDGDVSEGNDHIGQWRVENTGVNGSNYAPATDAAERWDGWRTALKPATEFAVLARKPFEETLAENAQTHGTGALNIGACRVGSDGGHEHPGTEDNSTTVNAYADGLNATNSEPVDKGRYPANVVFDEAAAERLDAEVGELDAGARTPQTSTGRNTSDAPTHNDPNERRETDSGGPSRYFYTSKASRSERDIGEIDNDHPTVKPLDLMEWVVRLATREGQIVLDPFAGSGTTCLAAKQNGRPFIGIEKQAKYVSLAQARIGIDVDDPSILLDDDQATVQDF